MTYTCAMGILRAAWHSIIDFKHTIAAKVESDLALSEHALDCSHVELGACPDCREEATLLRAS